MIEGSPARSNRRRPAGFRFSPADAVAIVVCALATWGVWPWVGEMALLLPIVLGHFFLFCNVFRIPRKPELLWGAVFVVNVVVWIGVDRFAWPSVLWTQSPVTLAVIVAGVLRRDYHGMGFRLVRWLREP